MSAKGFQGELTRKRTHQTHEASPELFLGRKTLKGRQETAQEYL